MRIPFQKLNLNSYYLFPAVMEDRELMLDMIQLSTGEILPVLQLYLDKNCSYHWKNQAIQMDLQDNFSIYISRTDPFKGKKYRYIYENPMGKKAILPGWGVRKVYLNTKGENPLDVPGELVHFLEYMENSTDECATKYEEDLFLQRVHQRVKKLKSSKEREMEYMLLEDLLDEREEIGQERGKKAGIAMGRDMTLNLVLAMTADGLGKDISRLKEPGFHREMMIRYHMS